MSPQCTGACRLYAPNLFHNKIALVTGGGTGIGYHTAQELLHLGAYVIIASRKLNVVQQARDKLLSSLPTATPTDTKQPPRVTALQLNIRDEKSVQQCVDQVIAVYGRLDLLVNNGGGQFAGPAASFSANGWRAVVDTNLTGTWLMCKAAYGPMAEQQRGVICNIIADMWNGMPGMVHTSAARAGVDNMTKTLAAEWGVDGIRINCVAPGTIDGNGIKQYPKDMQETIVAERNKHNYAYRLGTEQEIVAAILFMLGPTSTYVTGTTLRVDGAQSIYSASYPPTEHTSLPAFDTELKSAL